MTTHTSHPDIIKRLKRAHGHLNSVITMLEEDRPCLDITQQLQAVESALSNAKKLLIHDHIDHCNLGKIPHFALPCYVINTTQTNLRMCCMATYISAIMPTTHTLGISRSRYLHI
jgi:uncharacterized protein